MLSSFRLRLACSLLVLVPLGLGTKFYAGPGASWVHGHAGGVLYVIFWTMVVLLVAPTVAPWKAACGVFVATCGLEVLQLWTLPFLRPVRQTFLGHALLGSTFSRWDIFHYAVGALCGLALIRALRRPAPSS